MAKVYKFDKAVLKREIRGLETTIDSLMKQYERLLETQHERQARLMKVDLDMLRAATARLKGLADETTDH